MELAHTADNDFFGLFIYIYFESGIFPLELSQSFLEFRSSIRFGRLYSQTHDWTWYMHTLTLNNIRHISFSQGFSCRTLYTKNGKDIPCFNFNNLFHLVCMHFHHSTDFQFFTQLIIPNHISFLKLALIDSNVG